MLAGINAGQRKALEQWDEHQVDLLFPFHWSAFGDLHTSRGIGMAEGPIPEKAIDDYACRWGLTLHEFVVLSHAIRALDNHHRKVQSDKAKKEADASGQ